MRATVMHAAGDVRIENVPDATIIHPTDAVIRVIRACICGSDLWPYRSMQPSDQGQRMGHEAIGVVEAVGAEVRTVKRGDVVEGLPTACVHLGFFGNNGNDGAQAEAIRIPYADGTLFALPVGADDALMPSLLTLADVMGPATTRRLLPRSAPARSSPSWVMGRWPSAASLRRSAWVRNASFSSAAIPTAVRLAASLAPPMW